MCTRDIFKIRPWIKTFDIEMNAFVVDLFDIADIKQVAFLPHHFDLIHRIKDLQVESLIEFHVLNEIYF